MAVGPQVRKNAFEASPEKIDVSVGGAELSPEEVSFVKNNLAKMNLQELDRYFEDNQISGAERNDIVDLVNQYKQSAQEPAEGVAVDTQSARTPSPSIGSEPDPAAIPETPAQVLARYAKAAAGIGADIGVSMAAETPGLIAGQTAGRLAGLIPGLAGKILAPIAKVGTTAVASYATQEGTENFIRQKLGWDEVKYSAWEKLFGSAGAVFGANLPGQIKKLPVKLDKKAIEGAMAIKQVNQSLVGSLADANRLNESAKAALVKNADSMFEERLRWYSDVEKMHPEDAARAALSDIPDFIKAQENLKAGLDLVPDISQAEYEAMKPTKEGFQAAQVKSKQRMQEFKTSLQDETNKAIELAKKGKISPEGLFVPTNEVLSDFESLISASSGLLRKASDGSEVAFKGGRFGIMKGSVFNPIEDPASLGLIARQIKSNPYLRQLIDAYRTVQTANLEVVGGSVKKGFAADRRSAFAKIPVNLTIGQLADLRQTLSGRLEKIASGQASKAETDAYSIIRSIEDKYLDKLSSNPHLPIAQAADNYKKAKLLSSDAAKLFDPIIEKLNADPSKTASVFLHGITDDEAMRFMTLKREAVAAGSPIIDERMPQYIARKILENEFGMTLFNAAEKTGSLSRQAVKELPKIADQILTRQDLETKMKIYLGADGWKSMKKKIVSAAKFSEDWAQKIAIAENAGNDKLASTLKANMGQMAVREITALAGAGSSVIARPFWILKNIFDMAGVAEVSRKVNQVVYSRALDDIARSVQTVGQAKKIRNEILNAFGNESPAGLRIVAAFDNQVNKIFLDRRRIAKAGVINAALNAGAMGRETEAGYPVETGAQE